MTDIDLSAVPNEAADDELFLVCACVLCQRVFCWPLDAIDDTLDVELLQTCPRCRGAD